jgi:hypothetical protein
MYGAEIILLAKPATKIIAGFAATPLPSATETKLATTAAAT